MNIAGLGSGPILGPELTGKNFLELVLPQPTQNDQGVMELGQMKQNSFKKEKFRAVTEPRFRALLERHISVFPFEVDVLKSQYFPALVENDFKFRIEMETWNYLK